ncbi:MAG: TonB-dependent receptor [Sulfuricellaceae bacterium]|nr:TonB-dependent receptor [Sulfuricellaceae bacterium]
MKPSIKSAIQPIFKLGLVVLALPHGAYAEAIHPNQLDEIVVTASRSPQAIKDVIPDISVITQEDIRLAGQSSLAEILQGQPGVEMASNGGPGSSASVYLRGANSGHTLVLVDGMRLGSATLGATALENIPPEQIERIEILRGPASHLYGSDAIGGVINIITRHGTGKPGVNVSAGIGSFNTANLSGGFGGEIGRTRFSLQAGYRETDGISAYSANNPGFVGQNQDKDGYRNRSLTARLEQTLAAGHVLGIDGFVSQGQNHYDGYTSSVDYYHDQTLSTFSIYGRNRVTENWNSLLRLGSGADHSSDYSTAKDVFNTNQTQFLWQNDIKTGPGDATLGVERLEQKVDGSTAYAVTSRTIQSFYAGYRMQSGGHMLQANLRNDDNSQFGSHATGYLGYNYRFAPQWQLGASGGTAFKAPTFNDLYYPGSGNPDLKAESSRNLEASLRFEGNRQHFSAVVFDNQIDDLIAWAPIAPGSWEWRPDNINEASLRGVTFSWQRGFDAFDLSATATFQQPEDAQTGKQLINRAREHGSLKLGRTLGAWRASGEWMLSGERFADGFNTQKMGGYGILNLSVRYALEKDWSVLARVNNLLDKEYELAQGYGTPGVNVFVGLSYQPVK